MTEALQRQKFLLHVFPSFATGGAQMRLVALANHFGSAFRHAVIALDGDLACRSRLAPELSVSFPALPRNSAGLSARLRHARTLLSQLRPDVLITSNWGAIEWGAANLFPLARHIHTEDGFGVEEHGRQLTRRVLARRLVLRRSAVVLPSRTLFGIAREVWRLPAAKLHYIPNGIDLRRFVPDTERTGAAPIVIGCVAALRSEKNLARLLRATHRIAGRWPLRLVIVGDGPERPAIQSLAAELSLNVDFVGEVGDTAPFYRRFDLFALSSDTEQMPLSVLEAMASGLAVVATDVGDIASMVAAENRPFISGRDDAALAESLRALIDVPQLRLAIGAANRQRAESDFDQMLMFRRYRALFDRIDGEMAAA